MLLICQYYDQLVGINDSTVLSIFPILLLYWHYWHYWITMLLVSMVYRYHWYYCYSWFVCVFQILLIQWNCWYTDNPYYLIKTWFWYCYYDVTNINDFLMSRICIYYCLFAFVAVTYLLIKTHSLIRWFIHFLINKLCQYFCFSGITDVID